MAKQNAVKKFMTPEGTLKYPNLTKPDTKYKSEGEYSAKIILTEADAEPLIEEISEVLEQAKTMAQEQLQETIDSEKGEKKAKAMAALKNLKAGPLPFKDCVGDDGEPNGLIEFNIKMKASFVSKKDGKTVHNKPKLFDAAGTEITHKAPNIWGGTRAYVAGSYTPYYTATVGYGVSLRLSGVQIIKLVNSSGGTAEQFGFTAKAGGYVADDSDESNVIFSNKSEASAEDAPDEF